jgi:hypothetical protein
MLEDGIPPSLRVSVNFCSFERYSHERPSCKHVGIFIGTSFDFCSSEINLEMRLGPHGKVDGLYGVVWGCHTHKKVLEK